jgi:hypothetical protein
VLLRPTPVDNGARYAAVLRDYPEIIYQLPEWDRVDPKVWTRALPSIGDAHFLANLTYHADLNVNVASTMTLDFSINDRPVVNIAFDVYDPPPLRVPLWDLFYQWEHYSPVVKLQAARFARSESELADHVNAYLDNPALDCEGRRRLVDLQVSVPVGQASPTILQTLQRIVTCRAN